MMADAPAKLIGRWRRQAAQLRADVAKAGPVPVAQDELGLAIQGAVSLAEALECCANDLVAGLKKEAATQEQYVAEPDTRQKKNPND